MSSGKIERIYLKNVENDFKFDESAIFTEYGLQNSIHFEPKSYNEGLKNDIEGDLKNTYEGVLDNHLSMIKDIHIILKNSQDLTQKQKYAYCNSQRFYMKLYLKRIAKKR